MNDSQEDGFSDSLPVTVKRAISDVSAGWLADYKVIDLRDMSKAEVEACRSILGRRLGTTITKRREVLLRLLTKVDKESKEDRIGKAIISDCLAAHEIGHGNFLGHFRAYCDLQGAFPDHILIQNDLITTSYLNLFEWGQVDESPVFVLAKTIHELVGSEWLAEMFALSAEKRRLVEHLSLQSEIPILKGFIETYIEGIESLPRELSCYGVGLIAWNKLREKLGGRTVPTIQRLRGYAFLGHPFESERRTIEGASELVRNDGKFVTLMRPKSEYESEIMTTRRAVLGLIRGDTAVDIDRAFISKSDCLARQTFAYQTGYLAAIVAEFPEIKALQIGELWLALHSLAQIQHVSGDSGAVTLLMNRTARQMCSDSACKLAVDLLHYRNLLLDLISLRTTLGTHGSLKRTYRYVIGEINQEEYVSQSQEEQTTVVQGYDKTEPLIREFSDLRRMLRKYYFDNKDRIDRYLKDPKAFFSKVLD